MTSQPLTTRLWLGIGAFALIQAGMSQPPAAAQAAPAGAPPAAAQGGEGGEGGEGGVDAGKAATDPQAFIEALDIVAGHFLAGQGAYGAGHAQAAGEMFAHPIGEVYAELEPVFQARGVVPFREAMERASAMALAGVPGPQVDVAVAEVIAALMAAQAQAPGPGATTAVQARVVAGMIDRAAMQNAVAARDPSQYEPYLDGYGFFLAARARAATVLPLLDAQGRGDVADRVRAALQLLGQAYPGAMRPDRAVDGGALLVAASQVRIGADGLH